MKNDRQSCLGKRLNADKLNSAVRWRNMQKRMRKIRGKELLKFNEKAVASAETSKSTFGMISVMGRRRAMEDAVTEAPGLVEACESCYDFFAVYDGHGGARVAEQCRDRLHQLVAKEVNKRGAADGCKELDYWENVMRACFEKMDEEVRRGGGGGAGGDVEAEEVPVQTTGSTAVVVMVGKEQVVVANCGDSRAVLCRGGMALPLSRDHKPDRADERERIEAARGQIVNWNGSPALGVLATSRSIGDHYLRPYVIAEPEITVTELAESDEFLVIASDGLWDVISNDVACEVVKNCLQGQIDRRVPHEASGSIPTEAAAMLAELAIARGSRDNISVVVVELKKPHSSIS